MCLKQVRDIDKNKGREHRKKVLCVLLVFCFIFPLYCFSIGVSAAGNSSASEEDAELISTNNSSGIYMITPEVGSEPLFNDFSANLPEVEPQVNSYAIYEAESKTFILGKNINEPLSPASITKVMTILLALERLELEEKITITREMYENLPEDYTRLAVVEGEIITVEDALYASAMISANDAALALALTMAPTEEEFAQIMNERAKELGCTNTYFKNSYGFADPEHLTTARDIVLILNAAFENSLFQKLCTSTGYIIQPTNKHTEPRPLDNKNQFISNSEYIYDAYVGGKTGYTDMSRYTLVAGAQKEERKLVGAIFGSTSSARRYEDMRNLFEYTFNTYDIIRLQPQSAKPEDLRLKAKLEELRFKTMEKIQEDMDAQEDISCIINRCDAQLFDTVSIRVENESSYVILTETASLKIQGIEEQQDFELPVFIRYDDETKVPVGFMSISIIGREAAQRAAEKAAQGNQDTSNSAIRIIFFFIGIPTGIFILFCVIIRVQGKFRKKENRSRPKLL